MKKIILLALPLILVACTKLHYTYIPPESEQGKQCVAQCLTQKNICEDDVAYKRQKCEQENRIVQIARDAIRGDKEENWHDRNKYKQNCSEIPDRCVENYNICFEACGGQIEVTEYK